MKRLRKIICSSWENSPRFWGKEGFREVDCTQRYLGFRIGGRLLLPSPWLVYMVQCSDKSLYTGITNNLKRRLASHNRGKGAAYTRSKLPVEVVYIQHTSSKSEALKQEATIKKLSRLQKLRLTSKLENHLNLHEWQKTTSGEKHQF